MIENLKTIHEVVLDIMKSNPKTRNSDNYLFYEVYAVIGKRKGINIEEMSVPRFFLHLSEYGFPSTETIRRTRQKIQSQYPELAGNSTVEGQRLLNEEVFKEYARKVMK